MGDSFNYHGESEDLLKRAIQAFADWAAVNWTMAKGEADTLTEPTKSPRVYERGYNDGIASISDAAALWLEEGLPQD